MTTDRYKKPKKIDELRGMGNYGTLGLEIALSIAFGFFGGRWLDEKFGTAPYLSGLGFLFGVGAAIKAVMRAHGEMKKEAEREERKYGNPRPIYGDDERREEVRQDEQEDSDDEQSLEDKPNSEGEKADR